MSNEKCLSNEKFTPPYTANKSVSPKLVWNKSRVGLKFEGSCLTLFRMEVGKGGGTKKPPPPTSSSPVTSTNVGISLKNFLTFSFNSFCQTGVQFQVCT